MQSELKPCPFCGGEPHLMHCGAGTYMVQCLQCKATTDDGCLDRISANWNRRELALSDKQAGEVKAEYSHEDRVTLASCLSWDINEITSSDVKDILERLEIEGYRLVRSALVDVPAVDPVAHIIEGPNGEDPRVYLTQKYDPRSPDFWLNEEARAKHRVTPLYASPPLSREGEDSAEVLKALKEAVEFANKANNYIAGQDLPASAGWLAVIAKADAALAATRSGSATGQKGCAE